MILIFGMRVRLKHVASGTFHCPRCGVDRQYELLEARRWFTVFFLPVIPMKVLGRVLKCTSCAGQFDEKVLLLPTAADLTTSIRNAMRAVVGAVVGAQDTPAAREAATEAMRSVGMVGYGDADLAWDMQTGADAGLSERLTDLTGSLDPHGRERFLADAVRIAMADGPLSPAEVAIVERVGTGLELSRATVTGVLMELGARLPS
jgi:zinc-ribbon family/Tellurite resistance protein TerB